MDASLKEVIQKMKPGDISDIIRTSSGFHIIHLREVKRAGEADPGETEVTFCQAVFPLKPDSTSEEMAVVGPQIEETLSVQGCSSLAQTAKKHGVRVETSKPMKWRSLPDGLKMLMKNTPIGKCTQPAMTPDGVVVTMLCSKKVAELKPPTREEISAMLEQEKFAKKAERELTQLRTTAFIDVKDSSLSLDDLQSKKSQ
jgi:peptidyl-prolyl cis-trans isomerase SurA